MPGDALSPFRSRAPAGALRTGRRSSAANLASAAHVRQFADEHGHPQEALTASLVDHGFTELAGKATSHRRFRHESGVVITVPGHGRQNLSQKRVAMIVRQLEGAGFDRDTVRRDLGAR